MVIVIENCPESELSFVAFMKQIEERLRSEKDFRYGT